MGKLKGKSKKMNEEILEVFLEKMPDIFLIADEAGNIEIVNQASFTEKYKTLSEFLEADKNKELVEEMESQLKEKEIFAKNVEIMRRRNDRKMVCDGNQ